MRPKSENYTPNRDVSELQQWSGPFCYCMTTCLNDHLRLLRLLLTLLTLLYLFFALSISVPIICESSSDPKYYFKEQECRIHFERLTSICYSFIAFVMNTLPLISNWPAVRRSQSALIFSILNHPCSFMVYYYLFGIFLP